MIRKRGSPKMKDGRTHLAYKAEQVEDLDTGAVVPLGIQPGDQGDTVSMRETLSAAGNEITTLAGTAAGKTRWDRAPEMFG